MQTKNEDFIYRLCSMGNYDSKNVNIPFFRFEYANGRGGEGEQAILFSKITLNILLKQMHAMDSPFSFFFSSLLKLFFVKIFAHETMANLIKKNSNGLVDD